VDRPWFKVYAADALLDSKLDALPPEAEGLVFRMWCICHIEGRCPADPKELARKTRRSLEYVLQYESQCKSLFALQDGFYVSPRMEKEKRRSKVNSDNANERYKEKTSTVRSANRIANNTEIAMRRSDYDNDSDLGLVSKETKVTEESFSLDATVSYVMCETGLAGNKIRSVLYEVIKREIDVVGIEPKLIANTLVVAWGTYDPMKLKFKRSPENFFGSGMWRKPASEWAESGKEETLAEKNTNALREMERRTKQN
jgi:uncharacterized protein YdaU (DUF1376 family)